MLTMSDRLGQEYDWNQQTQSTILSSFFWGYVFTQVPAGQLAERFGPKMIIFFAMLISSILTMLTPICASFGGWKVCITRNVCTVKPVNMDPLPI